MKATTTNRNEFMRAPVIRYPNAAPRRQIFRNTLDFLLLVASGAGIGAMLFLLLAIMV